MAASLPFPAPSPAPGLDAQRLSLAPDLKFSAACAIVAALWPVTLRSPRLDSGQLPVPPLPFLLPSALESLPREFNPPAPQALYSRQ